MHFAGEMKTTVSCKYYLMVFDVGKALSSLS